MPQNLYLYGGIAAAAVLVIFALRLALRRRKRRKELEEMSQIKARDEALNEALRNPRRKAAAGGTEEPMEIIWDDKAVKKKGDTAPAMVELVELSAYSRRKFVFRAGQPVTIGSGKGNQLVLPREGVAERHCEIHFIGSSACIKGKPGVKTVLVRGKKSVLVSPDGIYLSSGDHIQMGEAEIQFKMLKV